MITLGIVVVILIFLYLSLLALLRAGKQRREQGRPAYNKLPQVSLEVINTLGSQLGKKIKDEEKLNRAKDYIAELKREQPALFILLVEILKQLGAEDLQGLASGVIVYKLLKAQVEVDLLDKSLHQSHH
ncbi:unnamed protein product [marine sediment metagenome]|uniref:Uncharacterized protein n=1 Tax=marine sediment metagenome TaxID=412755 RepID=X1ETL7_9ZZZZ